MTAAHVTAIKRDLATHRRHAAATATQIHDENQSAAEKHDQKVHSDIGFALAALSIAAIAFAWGWFRASAAVAYLTRKPLKNVVLALVGFGLVTLLLGGVLADAGGLLAVFGGLAIGLSFALTVALLLARHSAEIQRGKAKAIFRRERMSPMVGRTVAVFFGLIFLVAFIASLTQGEPDSRQVSAQLQDQMKLASDSSPQIKSGEDRAATLRKELAPLRKKDRRASFEPAHRRAEAAARAGSSRRTRTTSDDGAENLPKSRPRNSAGWNERKHGLSISRKGKNANTSVPSKGKNAKRKSRIRRSGSRSLRSQLLGACLHEGIGDYDCAGGYGDGPNYVEGPIEVVGVDQFGLDEDGDGIACEDGRWG